MLPFPFHLQDGEPVSDQIIRSAHRALANGDLRPGDLFPSVRTLAQDLKISPTTAHKVIGELIADRLLEVQPGLGTVVAKRAVSTPADRTELLNNEVERLVVEAKRLGIKIDALMESVADHWYRLEPQETPAKGKR